uniref:NikS-like protein n=1 Tax=Actinomyces sp. Lu 9419 TaxID=416175 RepID=B5SP77_9ACTO|nr:NikS-like protein [Actinomyces sp. Lu 9419]
MNRREVLADLPAWLPGERVVVVTARTAVDALPHPVEGLHRVEVVADDHYGSADVESLCEQLCREEGVTRVLSTAEVDIVRAARLRERLGLPGQSVESATAFRDKHVMKTAAAAAGVRTAEMALVDGPAGLLEFAERVGCPVVVKPVDGAGSIGVRVVGDEVAARTCELSSDRRWLAEQYLTGRLCHVDGLMAWGLVLLSRESVYLHSNLDTVARSVPSSSAMLPTEDPLAVQLRAQTAAVVAALPPVPDPTAFHAEFFAEPGGPVLCEIACRPGGCGIVESVELSTSVNLYAAQLRGQAGLGVPLVVRTDRFGWAWFPPRAATLRALPENCPLPGTRRWRALAEPGTRHDAPASSTDRVAELVFRLEPAADADTVLREIDAWWDAAAVWSNG